MLKTKDVESIIDILNRAKLSEKSESYIDPNEDYQWGPGLGVLANSAKKYNKEINRLIKLLVKEYL